MILVIGGAHQGKLRQVLTWMNATDDKDSICADGTCDPFAAIENKPVIYGVQAYLWRCLTEHQDPQLWLNRLLEQNPEYIIMDEVGYGIVPAERKMRDYRELVGYAGRRLAQKATAVYRIVCGIPMRIK